MDPIIESIIFGLAGGILAELAGWYKLRYQPKPPAFLHSPRYWIVTIGMILAGGFLVFVYLRAQFELNPIIAMNVGASAPLIIRNFGGTLPPNPGTSNGTPDIPSKSSAIRR
jgi:hypothetical protein